MAKHDGTFPCGGKKKRQRKTKPIPRCCGTKRSSRTKKKRSSRDIPCKDIQHHAKNCSACKKEMQKRKAKRCAKKPLTLYQRFYAYISKRLRSKYPGIKQCLVMKKAAQCWGKLTKEQKEDFRRKCNGEELDPTSRGNNAGGPSSSGSRNNGGGGCGGGPSSSGSPNNGGGGCDFGCCNMGPPPEEVFTSPTMLPSFPSSPQSSWMHSPPHFQRTPSIHSSPHFQRSFALQSLIFQPPSSSSLQSSSHGPSPVFMSDSSSSHYVGTGKPFP